MKVEFDPNTAENPFEHRVPKLPPDATARERALAERYTRISFVLVGGGDPIDTEATLAWLEIDQQSWCVTSESCTTEEANWHCWMLAKALARMIAAESEVKR